MDTRLLSAMRLNQGQLANPEYPRLANNLRLNLSKLKTFLRQSSYVSDSQSILHQLITMVNITLEQQPLYEYWDAVDDLSINLQKALGFTSSLASGKVWKETIYPAGVMEYVVAVDSEMPTTEDLTKWKDWTPVTIINHDGTKLDMAHLDAEEAGDQTWAVISVNIPLLLLQYQLWRKEQREKDIEFQPIIGQFLMQYPLANSLASHLDIAIVNRGYGILNGNLIPETQYTPRGISLLRLERDVDTVYSEIIDDLSIRMKGLGNFAENYPLPSAGNLYNILHPLDGIIVTRQVYWLMLLGSVTFFDFIVQAASLAGETNNSEFRNRMERIVRSIRADRSLGLDVVPNKQTATFIDEALTRIGDNLL